MKFRMPYLDFWFDIWLISMRTRITREAVECDVYEYIWLAVKFFGGRYGFSFRLYSPHIRRFI